MVEPCSGLIDPIRTDQVIQANQKCAAAESNRNNLQRVQGHNLSDFIRTDKIRRAEHRHRISRLEVGERLLQPQSVADRSHGIRDLGKTFILKQDGPS